jgi:hypothetical protein
VGLNQQQVAAAGGLTHEAISFLDVSRRAPLASTVRKLVDALEVEPTVFVARANLTPNGLTTA